MRRDSLAVSTHGVYLKRLFLQGFLVNAHIIIDLSFNTKSYNQLFS